MDIIHTFLHRSILKKIILFYFFFLFLQVLYVYPKAEIPMGHKDLKTLRVTYEIKGQYKEGTEVFIQKDGKTYRKKELKTQIVANTFHENSLEIDDGQNFYRVNLINNTYIQLPSINQLKKEMIHKNPHLFKEGTYNPLDVTPPKGKLKKTEYILEKPCDVYIYNNKMIYLWDKIILKEVWNVLGKITKTAIKIEINIPIEDHIFELPDNVLNNQS